MISAELVDETLETPGLPSPSENIPTQVSIKGRSEDLSLWLLSRPAEALIQEGRNQYDLVLVDLPSLKDFPEGIKRIQQGDLFIQILTAGASRKSQLKKLQDYLDGSDQQQYFVFLK